MKRSRESPPLTLVTVFEADRFLGDAQSEIGPIALTSAWLDLWECHDVLDALLAVSKAAIDGDGEMAIG